MHLEDIDISESQETWKHARDPRDEGLRMANGNLAEADAKSYPSERMAFVKKRRAIEFMKEIDACNYSLDSLDV